MNRYKEATKDIPWASAGRETVASRLGRSLLPIGVLPFTPPPAGESATSFVDNRTAGFEQFLMEIHGTAMQVAYGKLVTCAHVIQSISKTGQQGYYLARLFRGNTVVLTHVKYQAAFRFVDPRTEKVNQNVDIAAILAAVKERPELPYEVPYIKWGDSTKLGVGDRVMVGGYPLGTALFLANKTHRGVIQPTFFDGVISQIIPAQNSNETRLLQLSMPVEGGMSGGAVFDPNTGEVLGMVFSGLNRGQEDSPMPFTYALPSEVIAPFIDAISFKVGDKVLGSAT
jgi:hypothetical protein